MTTTIAPPRPPTGGDLEGAPVGADEGADRQRARSTDEVALLAEVATVAFTMAAVVGMSRLFVDWSFAAPLLAVTVIAHGAAILLRRTGVAGGLSLALLGGAGILVVSWLLLPETLTYGIPTGDTLDTARAELSAAWETFTSITAPAPVDPGFVLASAAAVWVVAIVCDTALFRLAAPVEGAVPASTLFFFAAALGAPRHRVLITAVFFAAALLYVLAARALRQARAVVASGVGEPPSARGVLARALPVGVLAVLAAATVGQAIPGAADPGVIPWRNSERDDGDARVTVSPLVSIRSRLVDQSAVEVFSVSSETRAYWRITALDEFDGEIWSSRGSYRRAAGALPDAVPAEAGVTLVEQEFTVGALASPWLPAAYRPAAIASDGDIRYDPESGSLLAEAPTSDGMTYRVQSAVPSLQPAELATAQPAPDDLVERYTALPADFPERVHALARTITSRSPNDYEAALALQRHLRENYQYSLDIQEGHDSTAIEQFLFETKVGYCEQFSGTFAAMARSVGLPARIGVGFTPGEIGPDGRYHVQGAHAHAWPEVYIDGYGWVAFEPTPGRGIPGGETYTGVPESQASPADPLTATTLPPTTVPGGTTDTLPADVPDLSTLGDSNAAGGVELDLGGEPSPWPGRLRTAGVAVVILAVAWVVAVIGGTRLRRHRRRAAARTAGARIELAWTEAGEALARAGVPALAWETNDEYARRAATAVRVDVEVLRGLAGMATAGQFSPSAPGDDVADVAARASAVVEQAAADRMGWRERLRFAFDPRPLLPRGEGRVRVRRVHAPAR